jgi:hypothetical protein
MVTWYVARRLQYNDQLHLVRISQKQDRDSALVTVN